jgi:hypothetical protein
VCPKNATTILFNIAMPAQGNHTTHTKGTGPPGASGWHGSLTLWRVNSIVNVPERKGRER